MLKKLLLLAILLSACAGQSPAPTSTQVSTPIDYAERDMFSTLSALQTQVAQPTETPVVQVVTATSTPVDTTCHKYNAQQWGGGWYLVVPEFGIFSDHPLFVNVKVECNDNFVFAFDADTLPAASRHFTVSFRLTEDGRKTDVCTMSRYFVDKDGKAWANSWGCSLRLKNLVNSMFCGIFTKDQDFAIYAARDGEQDALSVVCK